MNSKTSNVLHAVFFKHLFRQNKLNFSLFANFKKETTWVLPVTFKSWVIHDDLRAHYLTYSKLSTVPEPN